MQSGIWRIHCCDWPPKLVSQTERLTFLGATDRSSPRRRKSTPRSTTRRARGTHPRNIEFRVFPRAAIIFSISSDYCFSRHYDPHFGGDRRLHLSFPGDIYATLNKTSLPATRGHTKQSLEEEVTLRQGAAKLGAQFPLAGF
jgi:hypothetical protein